MVVFLLSGEVLFLAKPILRNFSVFLAEALLYLGASRSLVGDILERFSIFAIDLSRRYHLLDLGLSLVVFVFLGAVEVGGGVGDLALVLHLLEALDLGLVGF